MIIFPFEFGTPAYDEAIHLRDLVLRKPLGLEFTPEQLAEEYNQVHFGCYDSQMTLLGCLTLQNLGKGTIKMRQVAVLPTVQRKGVGQRLVRFSEIYAQQHGFKKITLHARVEACPFYQKLAYNIVGEQFFEVGIPHFEMEKTFNA
jgi:predicted GNAT family N-acyltransferase